MRYALTAEIRYDYGAPSVSGRTALRLVPACIPGLQRCVWSRLTADPAPAEVTERPDFFGTAVTEMAFRTAARATVFRLSAEVERQDPAPPLDLSPPLDLLAARIAAQTGLGPEAPHHFLGPSPRLRADPAFAAFARQAAPRGGTTLATLRELGARLHAEMRFDAAATTVETDPAEALAARHGVCQDFSHILIGALRALGVPAGYVSGYLRTDPPPGRARLTGADAMHAWVTAWCGPQAGWIDYDPTNDRLAGPDHIRVAVGRDYDDVAPVRGVLRSAGPQASLHRVDVLPLGTP
ncbi:MAG: transglutaminase family protein [Alkalilacustris sp.]